MFSILLLLVPLFPGNDENLLTRAERSGFTETTRFSELLEFLHVLEEGSDRVRVEIFGVSAEGRPLPLVVVGNPPPDNPGDIDRETTTVLFIQANIHAGEVEGKEACLMLLRDIVQGNLSHLLDGTVLLVAPDFNADGNEKISLENRPRQHGPEGGVGIRANAQNLDLNRDFMKLESREVQSHLSGVLLRWDPDLLVDCHTTNGSLHAEPITWAVPHNPLGDQRLVDFSWNVMLPWISAQTRKRDGYPSIPYGYWINRRDPEQGWQTFGPEPRYGTNYWGLRNRLAILIEMYAYAGFETRVRACYSFLRSIIEFADRSGPEIRRLVQTADRDAAAGRTGRFHHLHEVATRKEPITVMGYEPGKGRPDTHDPGARKDYTIPFHGRFRPAGEGRPLPEKGYVFPRGCVDAYDLLTRHGIRVVEIDGDVEAEYELFEIEEIVPSKHLFQGHHTHRLEGNWVEKKGLIEGGSWFVPAKQPLAMLAACLLEPESGDGLAFWNKVDRFLTRGTFDPSLTAFPVRRWVEKSRPPAPAPCLFSPGKTESAELKIANGIPLLILEGTPSEMGKAYGSLAAGPITALVDRYIKPASSLAGGMERLVAESSRMDPHVPERFREEMKALADTMGRSYGEIFAGNAFPDIYRKGGCSTFAALAGATTEGAPLLARNLDFFGMGILEKTSLLVVYRPVGQKPFVSVSWPGLSGVLSAMNGDGLCCAVMEVRKGEVSTDAMPSTLLFRRIMEEADDVEGALAILDAAPKAAANNLMLIDTKGGAAVAEIGPGFCRVRRPVEGMIYSTNHHRIDKKKAPRCRRYARFGKLAKKMGGEITIHLLKGALIDVNQGLITVQSMIFEPASLRIHVAVGMVPASRAEYETFSFEEILKRQ